MIGTLFFVAFFLLVLAWVILGSKDQFDAASRLSLNEAQPAAPRATSLPEPSDD